jgi:hypothetical protein
MRLQRQGYLIVSNDPNTSRTACAGWASKRRICWGTLLTRRQIEDGHHHTVEDRQDERGRPFADLAMIVASGHISPKVEAGFHWPNACEQCLAAVPLTLVLA